MSWTLEQAANDLERYVLQGEPPSVDAAAMMVAWARMGVIDRPTCHDIASHGGMQPAGAIQWFECSECHCKAQTDKIGMALHFCPHCGAEVVE